MCIFAGSSPSAIEAVSNTNIFARMIAPGAQVLVYAMTVAAAEDVAMILPVPVPPNPREDALRFINLEPYPRFFDDLRRAFPSTIPGALGGYSGPAPRAPATLAVHDVGAFEASFVPALADFARLDRRFTLPASTWDRLPIYRDWGFAVFKLRGFDRGLRALLSRSARTARTIHPMAFAFPTRHPGALFFPTVHVHDGQVHESAPFNHALYCQLPDAVGARLLREVPQARPGGPPSAVVVPVWATSGAPAATFVDASRSAGTVEPSAALYRRFVVGAHPNQDWWIPLA
jgi:hypothetical protein